MARTYTAAILVLFIVANASATEEAEKTRDLWNTAIRKSRAAQNAAHAGAEPLIGVTVWRLRAPRPADGEAARLLVHEREGSNELTAERVSLQTAFDEGQRVRIGIESAMPGYLYVFSQEQYRDESVGEPYMIFPTLRIHAGDNRVRAGRLVELPGWTDQPPYFRLRRSRPDHKAENIIVVVSPKPLEGVEAGETAKRVDSQQLQRWRRAWGSRVQVLESSDSTDGPYRRRDREKVERGELLTASDPVPQTLFRVSNKPGEALLVTVPLQIAER